MTAPSSAALPCAQCGAILPGASEAAADVEVHTCEYCGTVTVTSAGETRIAGRKTSPDSPIAWHEALCCRLCGGPLPSHVIEDPAKARCSFCGHRALLRPGVLAALRLAVTKPRLAPPTLRRALLYNLSFVLLAIGITGFGIWRHDGATRYHVARADIAQLSAGSTIADWTGDVPAFTRWFGFQLRARDFEGGAFGLRVTYRHLPSGTCQSQIVNVYAGKSRFANRTANLRSVPTGAMQATLAVESIKDAPVGELEIRLSGNQAFSVGWLALLLNALLWLTFFNVRAGVDFTALRRRGATATKLVTAGFLVFWFAFAVLGWNPLADRSIREHARNACPAAAEMGR